MCYLFVWIWIIKCLNQNEFVFPIKTYNWALPNVFLPLITPFVPVIAFTLYPSKQWFFSPHIVKINIFFFFFSWDYNFCYSCWINVIKCWFTNCFKLRPFRLQRLTFNYGFRIPVTSFSHSLIKCYDAILNKFFIIIVWQFYIV